MSEVGEEERARDEESQQTGGATTPHPGQFLPPHNLVAGKTLSPDNDSDDSESRTRAVSVLDAYESSVHGLSYAVSFVSILTILHEMRLADYGGRWARDHGPVITIILG